jgi:hypothetical protein
MKTPKPTDVQRKGKADGRPGFATRNVGGAYGGTQNKLDLRRYTKG